MKTKPLLAAFILTGVGALRLSAQPLFAHAEAIEATVASAEHVVIARVTGVEAPEDPAGGAATVTARVEEVLKGEPGAEVRFPHRLSAAAIEGWRKEPPRLLIGGSFGEGASPIVVDLSSDELWVLTADLALLRKPDDIIAAARRAAKQPFARRGEVFRLVAPRELVEDTRWEDYYGSGGYLLVTVPVDERLETRALEYIASDSYARRLEGVKALRHFKSEANIERLRGMLDDPGWSYLARAENNEGLEIRVYGVRQAAYEILEEWGVEVEKPLLREEVLKLEAVESISLANREFSVAELKDLTRFPNLESLFFWNTAISDAHLEHLRPLDNLTHLYLAGTAISDTGLRTLAAFENLKYLDLAGTDVTDAGVEALRERLPDVRIER